MQIRWLSERLVARLGLQRGAEGVEVNQRREMTAPRKFLLLTLMYAHLVCR